MTQKYYSRKVLLISCKVVLASIYLLCSPRFSVAQPIECNNDPIASSDTLDDAGVRAKVFNNGGLFWQERQNLYEVPKGSGINSIFTSSIWIAGKVDNDLWGAGSTYGPYEFWPGPLDEQGLPPDDCTVYDRIWNVRRADFEEFEATGRASIDMEEWPWELGAPVRDGDGDPFNYNLRGGDRPDIIGTQALWWVMNDRGGPHNFTNSQPMGLEIHGSALVFAQPFHAFLNNASFYKFRVINKNKSPLEETHFGFWLDIDHGNASDDAVGSDSLLQLAYMYNADNDDENGYGLAPPAIGATLLISPRAQPDQIDNDLDGLVDEDGELISLKTIFNAGKGGGPYGDPSGLEDIWNHLNGRWRDGSPLLEGGLGYPASDWPENFIAREARFAFPGDPTIPTFWTEQRPYPDSSAALPGFDKRVLMSSGPYTHHPGDTLEFIYAIVWSKGSDHLDSVRQLKEDVHRLRIAAPFLLNLTEVVETAADQPSNSPATQLDLYPNPFSHQATLQFTTAESGHIHLQVFDMLGREVATVFDNSASTGTHTAQFDGSHLAPGVYYVRLVTKSTLVTKKLVLVR